MCSSQVVRLSALLGGAFLVFVATCLAPAAPASGENDRAREAWMSGYLKIEEAAKAENGNNQVLALDLYREALTIFNQVKAKFPNWSPSLLDYRINFCTENSRRLEALVAAKNVNLSKPELVTLSRNQQDQIKTGAAELSDVRKKLDVATQALERARAEAARNLTADTEMTQLLAENREMKESVRAASERENQLRREVEAIKSETGLKAKADQLQQKLDATLAQQAQLKQTADAQKSALLNALAQLKDASLERERLAAELGTVRKNAEKEEARANKYAAQLAPLQKQLQKLGDNTADLTAENKRQEQALSVAGQNTASLQKLLATRQTQLRALEATVTSLQKAAGANKTATGAAEPEARVKALEQDLAEARGALAKAKETLAEQEDAVRQIEDEADLVGRDLAASKSALATAIRQFADLKREQAEQTQALDTLQKRNAQLLAQLAQTEKERRAAGTAADLQARLTAAETRRAALENEMADLGRRHQESQQLARRQEEKIGQLEKTTAEKTALATEQQKTIAELNAGLLPVKDLTAAMAGLKGSLNDAQAAAKTADARARQLDTQITLMETRIAEKDKELTALRADLLSAKLDTAQKDDPLRQATKALAGDLERERAKVKALEETLAAQQAQIDNTKEKIGQGTAPPAPLDDVAGRQRLASLETSLKERENEAKELRLQLAKERVERAPENDPLLDELRNLNRDLDREREKTKKMEKTLADQAAGVPGAVAVTGQTGGAKDHGSASDRGSMAIGFLQMAATAEKQGKTETAVWNYKKALEYQPDNRLAVKRLGLISAQTGNDEETEAYLKRAFYADPDDVDVLLPLGFTLVRQGRIDLAISMLSRAAALHPDDSAVHRAYGVACSSLGWSDAAEAQFRRSLTMNDKDGEAAFNLSVLLASRQPARLDEARKWYQRAKELGVPADPGLDKVFGPAKPAN